MKYIYDVLEKEVLTFNEMNLIVGDENLTAKTLKSYTDKKLLKRVRRDLYALNDPRVDFAIPSKYQIASKINKNSFVSHSTAFGFYGYSNQVYYNVNVSSLKRFKDFYFEDYFYQFAHTNTTAQVNEINGVKVTSIERTIVDSIKDIDKITDIEDTAKRIIMVESIDYKKMLDYLDILDNKILYKKVGYVLEAILESEDVPADFLEICLEKGRGVRGHLMQYRTHEKYNAKWELYGHKDLKVLVNKGIRNMEGFDDVI